MTIQMEDKRDKREEEYDMGEVATEGRMWGGTPDRRLLVGVRKGERDGPGWR